MSERERPPGLRSLLRPQRIAFTTDDAPAKDRFNLFVEHVRAMVGPDYHIASDTPDDFGTTLEMQPLGSVALVNVKKTSHVRATLDPSFIPPGGNTLALQVCHWGCIRGTHGTVEHEAQAGDAVVTHGDKKTAIDFGGGSRFHSIYVAKDRIYPMLRSEIAAEGMVLSQSSPEVRLLNAWLLALSSAGVSDAQHLAGILESHTLDLLALAMGARDDTRESAEHRTGKSARLHAILDQIASRSSEPLTAETVGKSLGITDRYVRQLLEETGETFSEHLLERRLQRAFALLSDQGFEHVSITEISLMVGFNDLSYFSREFRRRFGMTPSDVRSR